MGTLFEAILVGEDAAWLKDAASQALDEVERLDALLSPYQPGSEIHTLNQEGGEGWVRLDREAFRFVQRSLELARLTEGAFDPAIGALIRCWGFHRGQGALPDGDTVTQALAKSGWHGVEVDEAEASVRFTVPGVQIHPGAIGKGYAVDRAVVILRELGVEAALIHGGTSTVYALGAPPDETAWSIGLCDPENRETRMGVTRLKDQALSTSGDYEQFFEVNGRRYSHLLDPRTGYPAEGMRSATVVAESAADTDALSTAAFVLGEEGARKLLEHFPYMTAVLAAAQAPTTALFGRTATDTLAPQASPCNDEGRNTIDARRLVLLGGFPLTLADELPVG